MSDDQSGVPRDAPSGAHVAYTISTAGLAALRGAVQSQLHGAPFDRALHPVIQLLCVDAHRRSVRVEQLLIALKHAWASLPDIERLPPTTRAMVFERLVTSSIEEFYATQEPELPRDEAQPPKDAR